MHWYLAGAVCTSSTRLLPYPDVPPTRTTAAHTQLYYPSKNTKASSNPHKNQHLDPEFCTNIDVPTLRVNDLLKDDEECSSNSAGCGRSESTDRGQNGDGKSSPAGEDG